MNKKINAAVLGCTGYTGLELINILYKHPEVSINFLGTQNNEGAYINEFDQRFKKVSLPKLKLIGLLKIILAKQVIFIKNLRNT